MEILQIIWFVLLGILLAAFLICGGFDFGVGMLMCRFNGDQKKSAMEAIAPFWDGNQVWLITAGGALFAAFPIAYAQILSTFAPCLVDFQSGRDRVLSGHRKQAMEVGLRKDLLRV